MCRRGCHDREKLIILAISQAVREKGIARGFLVEDNLARSQIPFLAFEKGFHGTLI
jgi:stage V sporulation protein SpoVS